MVTAKRNKVLVAMSQLAANVRIALGDATPVSAQIAAAETFTTSSLEAAHEYGLGQDALWAGKYELAIQHYQESLRFDPKLGRAYSGLAVVAVILGHHQEALDHYKQALANLDRMSEREKLRTLSGYYTVTRDTDKAIEELNTLIERYPGDTSGHANLALAYFYTRNMKMALEEGERAVQISPKNVLQRNNVGLYAMYAGDFERAVREQRSVLELNPSLAKAYVGIALSQAGMNRLEDARKTYRQMEDVDSEAHSIAVSGLADLSLYEGDAAGAIALLEPEITADLSRKDVDAAATKRLMLAEAESSLRHNSQALDEAREALKESTDSRTVFLAARVLLTGNAKDQSKAAELSNELAARPDNDSHAYSKLILGELRLQRDEAQESLRLFKEALHDSNAWLVRFDLGQAYVRLSEFPEADSELELCLQRRGEVTAAFLDEVPTTRFLSEVYYFLGRTQEGLNSPSAADSFKTFLSMKSKATNDGFVLDARQRLHLQ
jgi:tetratricopeptide (TPR) repeat protein